MSVDLPVSDLGGVVVVIPARGGSQGIPRKNLASLAGRPLIAYTIEAARACPYIDRVIVSTDDEEIAQVAREWGAEVPFLRPPEFATSTSTMRNVVQHARQWLQDVDGWHVRVWGVLYPTSPFRTSKLMNDVFRPLAGGEADSMETAVRHQVGPFGPVLLGDDGYLSPVIAIPKAVYQSVGLVTGYASEPAGKPTTMVVVEDEVLLSDVDGPEDLSRANRIIAEGRWLWEDLHVQEGVSLA